MHDGFLDEVRWLLAQQPSRTAMQALGYRELADHVAGKASLDEALDVAITLGLAGSPVVKSDGFDAIPASCGLMHHPTRSLCWPSGIVSLPSRNAPPSGKLVPQTAATLR